MSGGRPVVSVVMATYNHADFVASAIDSVLAQQGVDFEFLVADDGSTDGTPAVVADYAARTADRRLGFVAHARNRGACVVTNELIERARGEFVALINSDDAWLGTDKLAQQLAVLRADPAVGACFGRAEFIDAAGRAIDKATLPFGDVFDQPNRTRGEWLRRFFDGGNCLCHPTVLIRRACYRELGGYDNRLRQLPDFDMWIRLAKRYDIRVVDRPLLAFRVRPGRNTSSDTAENRRRTLNECFFILDRFFDDVPPDVLVDGFGDLMVDASLPGEAQADIEKALLYFGKERWAFHVYHLVGLAKLHRLLGSPAHRELLARRYDIDDLAFQRRSAEADAFDFWHSSAALTTVGGRALAAELARRLRNRWSLPLRAYLRRVAGRLPGIR